MSDSIWKKEISLRRTPKNEEPAETPESVRVKQLAFQQKLAEAAQAAAPVPAPAPVEAAPEKQSVWKKEISFKRKPETLDYEPPKEIELKPLPPREPAPANGEPESIWKKEISFRRKPREEGDELPEPPVSIWKKEITFRRKPDGPAQERGESIWTKDISLRRRQARSAQVRALAEEALKAIDDGIETEPWLAEPELPPEPLPEPAAVPAPAPAVAPSPAAEQAAQASAAPDSEPKQKTSIWKRELGGSKKAKKAKEPKEPKAEKQPKPKKRLRDVQISMPKRAPKAGRAGGGSHPVKRLVGLKVGASQIAAARVNNNGAAELVQVARQPLEQGVVVGGEVRDPEALAVALKQFFAKNKLPRKNVRLGIASNRIGVRIFDLVGIDDDKQLENAIRFRAQETLPIPLDEAVLDYHVLGETTDEDGTAMQRVLLVVAYRELVDRYVSACKKAGITLAGVDLEAFALLRSLAAPRGDEADVDSALVAVSIGHDRSTFAVSDGRICEFTRVIEWGGSTLSVAIARALDLAPSEVESLKRLVSLESPAVPEGVTPEQYAAAVDAVRRQVQAFARELVSSLQFYQHQPGSLGIGEIVVTGGTAGLAGLAAELQGLIGVSVRVGDPLARLKVAKKVAVDEEVGSYAIAIGLGIED
ncbi:MAG TPA: type IV pilus assembly protein PilM [Gaiellaceae bacterium]|nr:type IV pilus assembly protein PilM [Gaiellaceae bacterium]